MATKANSPTDSELKAVLDAADVLWFGIIRAVEEMAGPLERQWKPSKAGFGRMCLLQHQHRTLLYLTPDKGQVWIAVVLGERAYGLAMASSLPAAIKLFSDAKPYAEGRGIRFAVNSVSEIPMIAKLVEIKTRPK
jgi:Protein of unknown function (DUF3788)